jgi:phosphatidylserine/phosphatidylglycerophosphate/cardiolipin synthase-like enzyme
MKIILALLLTIQLAAAQKVYFSPKGGCTQAVTNALNRATNEVLVAAYSFTSVPIASALNKAHVRKVKVSAILDSSNESAQYSMIVYLRNQGIPVRVDSEHAIFHDKYIIIDRQIVLTGSFNYSKAAEESNAENLLIIRDKKLALEYIKDWEKHFAHSQ